MADTLTALLERAAARRSAHLDDPAHTGAFRLFAGFAEGCPELTLEVYARTVVLHDYAPERARGDALVAATLPWLRARLPWLRAVLRKVRNAPDARERNGALLVGDAPDSKVCEHGVWYAVDLALNRDTSFYIDARNLRAWTRGHLAGRSVLNTFAYTCSLGVAARAGGAARVVNADRNERFLAVGRASYALNGLAPGRAEFQAADFFPHVSRLKRSGERFDCVLLDPPFFSSTRGGVVDLERSSTRLINKVRPLIAADGRLVVVNNALYLSGAAFLAELGALGEAGYVDVEETIAVPDDCPSAASGARVPGSDAERSGVADPAPFNHSTKIAVLRVRRKP